MEEKLKLYSNEKVWKVEKKIYSIMNLVLIVPVTFSEVGYFAAIALVMAVLRAIFPPLQLVSKIILFVAVPYLGMKILLTKKLDGKNPVRYFADYLGYILSGRQCLQNFLALPARGQKVRLGWSCTTRTT